MPTPNRNSLIGLAQARVYFVWDRCPDDARPIPSHKNSAARRGLSNRSDSHCFETKETCLKTSFQTFSLGRARVEPCALYALRGSGVF